MEDGPRYSSLRDYVRVLRDHRIMVVGLLLLFGGAAYFLSARQTDTYEAEARLSFHDPAEELDLLGRTSNSRAGAQFQNQAGARTAIRPGVVRAVKRRLRTNASLETVREAVTARIETKTSLVVLTGKASSAGRATEAANAYAEEVKRARTAEIRREYAAALRSLRRRFRQQRIAGLIAPAIRADQQQRIATLQSLRDIARPVKIEDPAREGDKTGPNPVRDGLLGALGGLVLGIVAAFVRDSLDLRLRGPAQIQSTLGLPILASVSSDALGGAGPSGGRENPSWERDAEAFRILKRNLDFLKRSGPIRSIAVTSALPEEGKSSVAASLAWAYATAGIRTLLIESDFRRPSLAKRLGIEPVPGLTDYLTGKAALEEVLNDIPIEPGVSLNGASADGAERGRGLLTCLPAGSRSDAPSELLERSDFKDFVAVASRSFDRVVLDTSPLLPVADTLQVLGAVDAALLCVRTQFTTQDEAAAVKAILVKFPDLPAGLVVTGTSKDDYPAYGYYQAPPVAAPATSQLAGLGPRRRIS